MRMFAATPESARKLPSAAPAKPGPAFSGQSPAGRSTLPLQRTDGFEPAPAGDQPIGSGYSFGRIPVHAPPHPRMQSKLKVNTPGDEYEQEADRVASWVTQRGASGEAERPRPSTSRIPPGSTLGRPLESGTNERMSRNFGHDFSNVRIHTDDAAVYLNQGLNARASTHGSDIYFNKGEYRPDSPDGTHLLAHELTHVVQQSQTPACTAPGGMIQRTTVGDVLDSFFSPFSSETLWVMPQSDNYTRIVRRWQPVIDAVNQAKADLAANCTTWSASHRTDPSWTPGMTDPPVTDPHAHAIWVSSPPGTDPDTCRNAFIVYATTKANPMVPSVQTFELYTCSIGSFGIYATVDSIDCAAQTAEMKIWMYNSMDQGSFGRFAGHPLFALSGMERQYMWWSWTESYSWGPPPAGGAGSGGGSSSW